MLDLTRADPALLQLADKVAAELLAKSTRLSSGEVMLVGAHCRDILQGAFGHQFLLRATSDIDLGLAISNWAAYGELVAALPSTGDTGIRFRIAQTTADLMPFGPVEDPPGTVTPATRQEPISVWGFTEVYAAALLLELPTAGAIRIPNAAGYAALKLAAWLDRSAYGEYKDAADIATVVYWYSKSPTIQTYIYETEHGQDLLIQEEQVDVVVESDPCRLPAAAHARLPHPRIHLNRTGRLGRYGQPPRQAKGVLAAQGQDTDRGCGQGSSLGVRRYRCSPSIATRSAVKDPTAESICD